ncbi:ComF family protein [uncultured Arthrobacter sp.]|uniref:ComF family protein n=1 Tax=uncultured Arthrobacter sp. TaxID=114050 RepID=UPI002629A244|nr:phosphoribosyltransferase family protein [uncultured Arthrobacter sp.]
MDPSRAALSRGLDAVYFGRPYQRLAGALRGFGTLVLPASCVQCGAWDSSLCRACLTRFRRSTARPFRAEAGAESLPDVPPPDPVRPADHGFGPLPVVAAGRYGGVVARVLLAYKNHGHVDLAAPVAAALAGALHAAVPADTGGAGVPAGGGVLLVPVPTRASSRRRRGYDPVMLLLARLQRSASLPAGTVLGPVVRHRPWAALVARLARRHGLPSVRELRAAVLPDAGGQKGLGRRRRRSTVLGSMGVAARARSTLSGRECVIVDDVLTTGATLGEVHRVLVACGATVLGAVVVAAVPPAGEAGRSSGADARGHTDETSPADG